MKQSLLVSLLLCFFGSLTAQITLKRSDFAVFQNQPDSSKSRILTSGVTMPTTGNNQVWDYSQLRDSTWFFTTYYELANRYGTPPAILNDATHSKTSFSGYYPFLFNIVQLERLDSTGYHRIGQGSAGAKFNIATVTGGANDSLIFPPFVSRFPTPYTFYKFPMTTNSVSRSKVNDSLAYTLSVAAFGLNKTPALSVVYKTRLDTVVGWGTLRLRNPAGGAALNFAVLLRRTEETNLDSFFLAGQPAPPALLTAFGFVQGRAFKSQFLEFLGVGFKDAHLYLPLNNAGNVTTAWRGVLPNIGLPVNSKEISNFDIATKVYPNPTTEGVTFAFDKTNDADWNVMIYNAAGQIIKIDRISAAKGATEHRVDLEHNLSKGAYFYNLLDENSLIRAKGQFVKMN